MDEDDHEDGGVEVWRFERLRDLGVDPATACLLAPSVDWHQLEALLAAGCPLDVALKIVG